MRWDSLFSDLEAQFSAERVLESESEITERARVELGSVELNDRLRGVAGSGIKVMLVDGTVLRGRLSHIGSEWIVLTEEARQWLVPHGSVLSYQGLGRLAIKEPSRVQRSLGIASALRALSRGRVPLVVYLTVRKGDGHKLDGVIDRVGKDHFDLAVVVPGEERRAGSVAAVVTVPFDSLTAISSNSGQGF